MCPLNVIIMSQGSAARAAGVRVVRLTECALRGTPDGDSSSDPGCGGNDAGVAFLQGELDTFELTRQIYVLPHAHRRWCSTGRRRGATSAPPSRKAASSTHGP